MVLPVAIPLGEFLDLADQLEQPAAFFGNEKPASRGEKQAENRAFATGKGSPDFADGPPCLEHLSGVGFPEGARNTALLNMATFAKKKYGNDWEPTVENWNVDLMKPPLPRKEISDIIRRRRKRDYNYQCGQHPLVTHCNSALCRTRRYGVGDGAAEEEETMSAEEAEWWLDIRIERLRNARNERLKETLVREVREMGKCAKHIDRVLVEHRFRIMWLFREGNETIFNNSFPRAWDEGVEHGRPLRRKEDTFHQEFGRKLKTETEDVDWLLYPYLGRGFLTIMAGLPGIAKSTIWAGWAANIVSGGRWLFGEIAARRGYPANAPRGRVLILSAEDSPRVIVMPRIMAAGGDPGNIGDTNPDPIVFLEGHTVQSGEWQVLNLSQDIPALSQFLAKEIHTFDLIIIDTIGDYMGPPARGHRDAHNLTDVSQFYLPLMHLAEEHHVTVLCITHPPKRACRAIEYFSGSMGNIAKARIGLVTGKEWQMVENDEGGETKEETMRRLLGFAKNNYVPPTDLVTMAYHTESVPVLLANRKTAELGKVVSLGQVAYSPNSITKEEAGVEGKVKGGGGKQKEAEQFIVRMLKAALHAQLWAKIIEDAAEGSGIAEKTLQRAKTNLKDKGKLFDGKQPGSQSGAWAWALGHEIQWALPLDPEI